MIDTGLSHSPLDLLVCLEKLVEQDELDFDEKYW